ncbi:uncharacterized protein RSE6_00415 [Rhynchosporium secalis]|uniref:Uncharacterized protein n=1 Tax=Rhynchosporium secalis TaxID=38038 RepID=A0A1E1LWX0_RHYSE|nr:uncharacterized protein RSE6_00415 [Rhynchosporium secalis]
MADEKGRRCYLESSRDVPNLKIYEAMGFHFVQQMDCDDDGDVSGMPPGHSQTKQSYCGEVNIHSRSPSTDTFHQIADDFVEHDLICRPQVTLSSIELQISPLMGPYDRDMPSARDKSSKPNPKVMLRGDSRCSNSCLRDRLVERGWCPADTRNDPVCSRRNIRRAVRSGRAVRKS